MVVVVVMHGLVRWYGCYECVGLVRAVKEGQTEWHFVWVWSFLRCAYVKVKAVRVLVMKVKLGCK